ncbi:hypothetical protein [Leisingera methylohalidivorans]|uniref:Uncharacterized protein n=1 Tax=Leisingera methylohalidivorans DSM 14336 TaxID=999552 RepID=V9VMY6_9RHOB|nr:hypothetical protein [Leisingera methylohalidivorans]AHC99965.1 hypothetical protein METH_03820 [Leisingera methylohalidivorans DSM 14336]
MTAASVITRLSAAKDLRPALPCPISDEGPTPIYRTFTGLIEAVDAAIGMERDLSHSMSWDPATSGFFEAAENQWQDCLRLASDIFSAPTASAEDQPLQRMAMLLHFLIEATSADETLRFQQLMHEHRDLFSTEVPDVRQALNRAARQVHTVVEMATAAQDFAPV